jgi:hypothetical protein
MMKSFIPSVLLLCGLLSGTIAHADQVDSVRSPDGRFVATIRSIQKATTRIPEAIIEIKDSGGKLVAREDFTSKDGEHGLSLEKAAWTADSRFFVFTTTSSGGHQPWQFPTFFFDHRDKRIHRFSDFLSPIAAGSFELKAPDIITITIWTPLTPEKTLDDSIELPITFRMSDLSRDKKSDNQ